MHKAVYESVLHVQPVVMRGLASGGVGRFAYSEVTTCILWRLISFLASAVDVIMKEG